MMFEGMRRRAEQKIQARNASFDDLAAAHKDLAAAMQVLRASETELRNLPKTLRADSSKREQQYANAEAKRIAQKAQWDADEAEALRLREADMIAHQKTMDQLKKELDEAQQKLEAIKNPHHQKNGI